MVKQTLQNTLFTGFAQLASLAVILFLAEVMPTAEFGKLNVQISAATILAILTTFQFERVYVRIRDCSISKYIAFHLKVVIVGTSVLFIVLSLLGLDFEIAALVAAISLNQVALYGAARSQRYRQIWLMKSIQAASLLSTALALYLLSIETFYWLPFVVAYFLPGLMVIDKGVRYALVRSSIRNEARRFSYSVRIALIALGSILSGSFVRELPLLLAGALGRLEIAAALGLLMRLVGAPIGLLARSASAVATGYVAKGSFTIRDFTTISLIPLSGGLFVASIVIAADYIPQLRQFDDFQIFAICLGPYFLARAYVGILGPVIIRYRIQGLDLLCNITSALLSVIWATALYFDTITMPELLALISLSTVIAASYLIWTAYKRTGAVSGEAV